ncbi:protein SHQ1 homolog isoform X2 [Erinaceus europaeus]|uniref:Protein SHQ1 homolog n=1 Tax=Erinaceus europaeus TaxID=9365 RepID=A0ABM3YCN9_ERIEU|nr:protein SHQ1 homolog isoform X2 [Erinaceus europaeus]
MLTPAFDLSQDPDFLIIAIRVPYARVSEFDVYFEGVDFKFYAKPYFLRLTLPGRITENGNEQGSYDADKGIFTIRLPKETPGQHFEGLNMLTALLAPKKSRTAKPLVEEIGASKVSEEEVEDEDEEFDWEIEQSPYTEESESALDPQCCYGFGNLRSGVFQRLQDELSDVIDIKDPDLTPAAERRQKRLAAELTKFDSDHYLADFFEDEAVEQVLKYNPWWTEVYSKRVTSLGENREQENHDVLGKSAVLKCLLDIHKIFQENDPAYILNDLYISDYCVWIQKAKSKKLAALSEALKEVSLTKAQLGLELEELEAAARLVQEEETASKASHSVSGQQTSCSSSEGSDSEESGSTTSSETQDSESEQEEPSESKSEATESLCGPFVEESSALLIDAGGPCRDPVPSADESQEKPGTLSTVLDRTGPLIEELGEQLATVVQISGTESDAAGNHSSVQNRDTTQTPCD